MNGKVILIENEEHWIETLSAALAEAGFSDILVLKSYTKAEEELTRIVPNECTLALIDVRMRRQLFDQGGLALLDQLRTKAPLLPVIMLTAYAQDYPGLTAAISRYNGVLAYEKDDFLASRDKIIQAVLNPLPPQVGESSTRTSVSRPPLIATANLSQTKGKLAEVLVGLTCIVLILGTGVLVSWFLTRVSLFPNVANVFVGLVTVCLMAVLVRVYGKDTVEFAIKHVSKWLNWKTGH
ncbi:MAG: response regulator [Pedosphaera sp.]|nr:response regulator [Pedosphaera sp.]